MRLSTQLLHLTHQYLRNIWESNGAISTLLRPFSWSFYLGSLLRAKIHRNQQETLPIPIIVIGNITVGGTGKTSCVEWLCKLLQKQGLKVGIISRGYKSAPPFEPFFITPSTPTHFSGDEAKLLALATQAPIAIDHNRSRAAKALIAMHHPDIILSDDGLQHYRLHRDFEIIMLNGLSPFGNGQLLPAGPLREPVQRTTQSQMLISTANTISPSLLPKPSPPLLHLFYTPCHWIHTDSGRKEPLYPLPFTSSTPIVAITALGNPEQFFTTLKKLSITLTQSIALADHSSIDQALSQQYSKHVVLITEKDRHKLQDTHSNRWSLVIKPELSPKDTSTLLQSLENIVLSKTKPKHPTHNP